jgi:hypothetical protein
MPFHILMDEATRKSRPFPVETRKELVRYLGRKESSRFSGIPLGVRWCIMPMRAALIDFEMVPFTW